MAILVSFSLFMGSFDEILIMGFHCSVLEMWVSD